MKKTAMLLLLIATISAEQLKVPSQYSTIQAAVDASLNGDTILVAAGTYKENVELINPEGGPYKSINVIGEDKNTTIIDGNQNGSAFLVMRNLDFLLKNFTIQNGTGWESSGGAVNINGLSGTSATAVLENLILKNNPAGGAVWANNSDLTIKNSSIESNTSFQGGGIKVENCIKLTLDDVVVKNNTANQGGGIYAQQTPVYFSGTVFLLNNHASTEGGGISFDGATPNQLLTNLVVAGNTAGNRGAGIVIHNSSFSIKNSTIVNNKANGNAGGLFVSHGTVLDVENSIFWNNSPQQVWVDDNSESDPSTLSFSYSDVQGGESGIPTNGKGTITWGTGNIDKSPLFVDSVAHNFNLKNWSPLIGVGKDGNDIGAFENEYSTPQNAPPVLTALSDVPVNEDASVTVTLEAINADSADNDVITFSSISDTSAVIASVSSSTLTLTPNANWHGDANITIYASDGTDKDSTVFKLTVTPVQDAPTAFEWVSGVLDTINITQSNLAETYTLQWDASTDVDGETINYLLYAQIGVYPAEEISDTTSLSVPITYQEILEGVFEGRPVNGATVRLNVRATDGIDTVDVTGDNRVIYVNRYDYLSVESEGIPTEFALHENYPNPFNPTTTLRFDLPEVSNITLTIFNMLGQKIRTYDMQSAAAGYHTLKWNATNDYGDPVGAGVYLYQLQSKDFVKTRKMVLLK
ncbi:T9SS type A sorting domain-containing protein [Candidatus Marinimicrobia bacterium]|nr:T9SS type A sorting domain-containing protein [Candidatus Neomarinimicrobiota bacterium]